ncbi:hypothetical protein HELRODRAFT_175102 [Helobdella robusta]|uniref:Uncharacterized protein n=1 Tax=Helobdella robusta TaxID=6412 RepID=T1F8U9_HELRO|nr:hypothetical protein HELRODRAFT_175102 [Helobdella robusta]ESO01075.1 hypothetical protein HELRODRAFT_175102 [Helobdella robusta]
MFAYKRELVFVLLVHKHVHATKLMSRIDIDSRFHLLSDHHDEPLISTANDSESNDKFSSNNSSSNSPSPSPTCSMSHQFSQPPMHTSPAPSTSSTKPAARQPKSLHLHHYHSTSLSKPSSNSPSPSVACSAGNANPLKNAFDSLLPYYQHYKIPLSLGHSTRRNSICIPQISRLATKSTSGVNLLSQSTSNLYDGPGNISSARLKFTRGSLGHSTPNLSHCSTILTREWAKF